MSVTFTQEPTYPIPGKSVRIGFTVSTGNYVKVYVTDAPRSSLYWKKLDEADASRVLLHSGDSGRAWKFEPDVSGIYQFAVDDISKGAAGYGGGWLNSPDSYQSETVNGAASTLTITVGTKMEMTVGAGDDTGTLRFYVWNDYCRETNVETHGETTPAIVDPSSERMENVIRTSGVVGALANLIGRASTTLTGSATTTFDALLDSIITKFDTHITSTTYHYNSGDTSNNIDESYKDTESPELFAESVSYVLQKIDAHIMNDDGTGPIAAGWHQDGSGNNTVDHDHRPIVTAASDQASAIAGLVSAWTAFAYHRQDTGVHKIADPNAATGIPTNSVLMVHFYTLYELSLISPTVATTTNQAVPLLQAHLGMTAT